MAWDSASHYKQKAQQMVSWHGGVARAIAAAKAVAKEAPHKAQYWDRVVAVLQNEQPRV